MKKIRVLIKYLKSVELWGHIVWRASLIIIPKDIRHYIMATYLVVLKDEGKIKFTDEQFFNLVMSTIGDKP